MSVTNTSHHLQQLRHARLVTTRKEGQRVFYRLNGENVNELIGSLRNVAERHLSEVDQLVSTYLTGKDSMEPISRDELMQHAKEGSSPGRIYRRPLTRCGQCSLERIKKNISASLIRSVRLSLIAVAPTAYSLSRP